MIALTNHLDASTLLIKNLGLAVDPGDAVSKSFAEQLLNNRAWKDPVRVAVTSNVNIASPGGTLDTLTMVAGDAAALTGQSTQSQNGIYIWNGAAVAMTRRADADTGTELRGGTTFAVTEGTSADRLAIMITDGTITVGTTAIQFVIMSTSGQVYTASNGLQLISGAFSILLDANPGLIASAAGLKIDPSIVVRKFAANVGNGSATAIVIAHNLGTKDVQVGLYDNTTGRTLWPDVEPRTVNDFTLNYAVAPATGAHRVVVQA